MEQIIELQQGYDCIKFECKFNSKHCLPKSGGSHGVHGLTMRFTSKGEKGAVQFVLYTGWLPQYAKPDTINSLYVKEWGAGTSCMPADLGYHSKVPMYDGQDVTQDYCTYCDGAPCYCDGSGLNSIDAMYTLVNGGDKALWSFLDNYYQHIFHGANYPKPTEYEMPLR